MLADVASSSNVVALSILYRHERWMGICSPSRSRTSLARAAMRFQKRNPFSTRAWRMGHAWRRCFPLCSVGGATLTIRRFSRRYSLDDLVDVGSVPLAAAALLRSAVASRQNVLISGGTGTGKTTLLNALAATIPDTDRIALIEETSEILLEKPNYVRFEARKGRAPFGGTAPLPPVTIADLLRATLRHRPDRIIVGEVRGAEAFDLLQALNTGHLGSMTTIHSNSAEQALTRLAHCVVSGTAGLPHASVREAIALAIDLVVHIAREGGQRRITELLAVHRYDAQPDRFEVEHLYTHGIPQR